MLYSNVAIAEYILSLITQYLPKLSSFQYPICIDKKNLSSSNNGE